MTEHLLTLVPKDSARIDLPHGIGYVEIRTSGSVHGPTGYPVMAVEVVTASRGLPADDGRIYEPARDRDCGVVLVGRPGPKLLEEERKLKWFKDVIVKHDSGDHSDCPDSCPAKES